MIDLLKQFANTYKECHYLAVGFAYGMLTGYIMRGVVHRLVSHMHEH